MNPEKKATILVVDDEPANLSVLFEYLRQANYKIFNTTTAAATMQQIERIQPDIILLDIMLPDMDGYQVCQQLKTDQRTREIPVIFISARKEPLDKVKAFSLGGVDYITKPFQIEETLARINTHLVIRRLQQDLQEQVAELNAFAHTLAHELKNPLGIAVSYTSIISDQAHTMDANELRDIGYNTHLATLKAVNIIDELLLLASVRRQKITLKPLAMAEIVEQAQERLQLMIKEYQAEIILPDDIWPVALGYAPWVEEVWVNYLSNGLKYGGRPPQLELGATPQPDGMIRFWIRDNGSGITPEAQAVLFTEFTRLNQVQDDGYGLGLSIVRRIVTKLGGQVGVESKVEQGSEFYFTLPQAN